MMSHLTEIDVVEDDDIKSGYTITFGFEKNDFFTNEKIVKKFHMNDQGGVENSTTKFNWKPVRSDYCLCKGHEIWDPLYILQGC